MASTDVAPANTIQGQVVQPTSVTRGISHPAHAFLNVIRDIIHSGSTYHTEDAVKDAVDAVNAYEQQVIPQGDQAAVVSDTDRAAHEDVTQRQAPATGAAVPVPAGPAIDYSALAQALVQAGFGQQPAGGEVSTETEATE